MNDRPIGQMYIYMYFTIKKNSYVTLLIYVIFCLYRKPVMKKKQAV